MTDGGGPRSFGLDLVRCLAVAAVVVPHGVAHFFLLPRGDATSPAFAASAAFAFLGVEGFFVLSGVLIGTILLRVAEGTGFTGPAVARFWVRRWFRTLPNYYLFLGVNALLTVTAVNPAPFAWPYLAFAQNLAGPQPPGFFSESWSLAVEEWFYLLFPLLGALAWAVARAGNRGKPGNPGNRAFGYALAVLLLAPTVLRTLWVFLATDAVPWHVSPRETVLLRLDAIAWGVLGAWLLARKAVGPPARRLAFGLGAGMVAAAGFLAYRLTLVPLGVADPAALWAVFPLASAGTLLCIPWMGSLRPRPEPWRRGVTWLSLRPYSLYLVHVPMALLFRRFADPAGLSPAAASAEALAWLGLTLLATELVYRFFEAPTTRLRERFAKRLRPVPDQLAQS